MMRDKSMSLKLENSFVFKLFISYSKARRIVDAPAKLSHSRRPNKPPTTAVESQSRNGQFLCKDNTKSAPQGNQYQCWAQTFIIY
jgi:hypothetical protein